MKDYSISVIIPAYNSERTIVKALQSVANQTVIKLIKEVIVINDGSTDTTGKLVDSYIKNSNLPFPIVCINKENGGVSTARNMGMKNAKGEWLALLDSDDEWYPNKLEEQFKVIQNHPEIDFLGTNHTDTVLKILGKKITKLYSPSLKEICIKMFPQTSTAVFKRSIFNEIGGYDEERKYCEDGQYFFKICEKYNYYYMPEQLVVFDRGRRGFGISGLSGNIKAMQDGMRKNLKELHDRKSIGTIFYFLILIYSELKYIRRKIICKMEKL